MVWSDEYKTCLNGGLSEIFFDESFADVTIEVEGRLFRCHKVILSAFSSYFKAMFTSQLKESSENAVSLPFLNIATFEQILHFMYLGKNTASKSSSPRELLKAANFMQIDLLQKKCSDHLISTLTAENCVEIWIFARSLNCGNLEEESLCYILDKFPQLIQNGLLFGLEIQEIAFILNHSCVNLPDEDTVTDFILCWLRQHPDRKTSSLVDACKLLRLPLTSPEYLFHIFGTEHKDLLDIVEISTLVEEAKRYQGMPAHRAKFYSTSTLQRNASDLEDVFIVIGGVKFEEKPSKDVYAYSLKGNKWYTLAPMSYPKGKSASACSYGKSEVYIHGGQLNSKMLLKYDGMTNSWKCLSEAPHSSTHAATVAIGRALYYFGGRSNAKVLPNIMKYSISLDQWIQSGALAQPVFKASAAVCDGKILIAGGYLRDNNGTAVFSDAIQCFDPRTGNVSVISTCAEDPDKHLAGCFGFDSDIIYVGFSRHIYQYISDKKSLEELGHLLMPTGSVYGMARRDNIIYVLGSHVHINERTVCHMVTYDTKQHTTEKLDVPFQSIRCPSLKLVVRKKFMKTLRVKE